MLRNGMRHTFRPREKRRRNLAAAREILGLIDDGNPATVFALEGFPDIAGHWPTLLPHHQAWTFSPPSTILSCSV